MMILQPHADDSGSDPQSHTFVFGGLVASPSRWLEFTSEWQAALDSGPIKLEYFKMTEAMALTGEFSLTRGWNRKKRDEKLAEFVEIILRHAKYGAWVSMRQADFKTYIRGIPLPVRNTISDTPFLFMITQFILLVCDDAKRHRESCVFDFVFDEQMGIEKHFIKWWEHIKDIAQDNGLRGFLDARPVFRNEKSILPLQAADLFAWEHRKHLQNNKIIIAPPSGILRRLSLIRTISTEFTEAALRSVHAASLAMVAQFATENPGVPMLSAGKKGRQTSKKASSSRKKKPS